jgi:site-specific DNA recombinase
MPKAIAYVRVSTVGQATEGVSLPAQEERIRAYCLANGYELVKVYRDAGRSGKRADNRPGLQEALTAACDERAVLVVYSLSRLARSTKDAIAISERLSDKGANLASLTERFDTASPMGEFVFTLMAALARLESAQLGERTRMGMDYQRSQGKRISRLLPMGYRLGADGETLVKDQAEQKAVRLVRENRALSLRQLKARLDAEGFKGRNGTGWSLTAIRAVRASAA